MKILTVVGARPQFVKAAIVSKALERFPGIDEVLVHTGQHYDERMSDVFFRELEIRPPAYSLGVGSASHGAQTGKMLVLLEEVIAHERPAMVLVYGDTNSTLAGALAAVKLHVPVAHVEAGLRSFNRRMPEEINRIVTDQVSDILFAPTTVAADCLAREGIPETKVHVVGDVMYDASIYYGSRATHERPEPEYVLATVHRAENTDDPARLEAIVTALVSVSRSLPVILPLHPRTRGALERYGLLCDVQKSLTVVEPVGYLEMLALERGAKVIVTDSGGVQKEAYFARVPCVTVRDETEWTELVDLGWNALVGAHDPGAIARAVLSAEPGREPEVDPYGGGKAAERVAQILSDALTTGEVT